MSRTKKQRAIVPEAEEIDSWKGLAEASPLDGRERRRQRMEHYRAPLKIKTPEGAPAVLTKWHGMPPRRLVVPKRTGGPIEL